MMLRRVLSVCFVLAASAGIVSAADVSPPKGFTSLFNGENLNGWHAVPHFDPRKLAEMPEEERQKKLDEWMADAKAHWTVDNGELVNDGKGVPLLGRGGFDAARQVTRRRSLGEPSRGPPEPAASGFRRPRRP
jgi:hypothetical protein